MRIHQILGAPSIILTNEEKAFVDQHHETIPLHSLYDREQVLARNLVRKGVYEISNDNRSIVLKKDVTGRKALIQS